MTFNPVDSVIKDVKVIHSGTFIGEVLSGSKVKFNATDLPNLKGGMFVTLNSSNEFNICNGSNETPFGMVFGDGSRPYEITVIIRGGLYMVKNWDTTETLSGFAPGAKLVVNATGKLAPLASHTTYDVVAVSTYQPASTSDYLGIKLLV